MSYHNFPSNFETDPMICSKGHATSPNGDFKPRGCPTCARGRQTEPKRKFVKAPTWRETMAGIMKGGR